MSGVSECTRACVQATTGPRETVHLCVERQDMSMHVDMPACEPLSLPPSLPPSFSPVLPPVFVPTNVPHNIPSVMPSLSEDLLPDNVVLPVEPIHTFPGEGGRGGW